MPLLHSPSLSTRRSPGIAILSRLLGKTLSTAAPEVYLGAFGKHPGWNDHIDDPGLTTQRLVDFKTLVYTEGVAPAIESGRWDALDAESHIEGFAHVFVVRSRGDLLVARMWTSRDGKGRDKYPMVVAAQFNSVPLDWALTTVLPELETVQKRCEAATTAQQVISILDATRDALRARAAAVASESGGSGGGGAEMTIPATFLSELAKRPEMGPNRQGLFRILYETQREMALYIRAKQPTSRFGRTDHLPSVHLRLPALATGSAPPAPAGAIQTAARLILSRLETWTPMFMIASLKKPFVDVILGEPQGPQLFCLQAGEKAIPLTTNIPYTIDAVFSSQTDAWMAAQASAGDLVVPYQPESVRKPRPGRFLLLALAAGAATALASIAPAQTPDSVPAPPATQPSDADPRVRYNDLLAALHAAVTSPGVSEAAASSAARKFIDDVRALPGGVAFLANVQRTLSAIERALDGKEVGIPADAQKLGPGAIAAFAASAEGDILRFKAGPADGLPELAFARLDVPGGDVVYLSTTELTVGQFASILSTRAFAGDLAKVYLNRFTRVDDSRLGPRSWEWATAAGGKSLIVPAESWLIRLGLGAPTDYPPGSAPQPPTLDTPINYISPHAALLAARLVGCRLPSAAEWTAAKAKFTDASTPNLRDETWRIQYDHAKSMQAQGKKAQLPDAGAFVPTGLTPKPDAVPANDKILWFSPAPPSAATPVVRNLVGNLAEYVLDAPDAPQPEARPKAIAELIESPATRLRVIGGSAISDPGIDPAIPQPVSLIESHEGYADVGFRLAFSAGKSGGDSIAARLGRLLEPLPILPSLR